MKLRPDQLEGHLKQNLKPVYVVSGDEPLLVQEAQDAIRAAARAAGITERELHHAERGFDWNEFTMGANTMSLFGDRKLIEIRFGNKPDATASTALLEYAENPSPDNVLLLVLPKLDGATQKAKWYTACDQAGVTMVIYPLDASALPDWLTARLRKGGLNPTGEAITFLTECVEGNLLAANQEVEKLRLLYGSGSLTLEQVQQAVGNSARYDVYELADVTLSGDTPRALRMLAGLFAEGTAESVVIWSLLKDLRALLGASATMEGGMSAMAALNQQGVWQKRQPLLASALQRLPRRHLEGLLALALDIDRGIKGQGDLNPRDGLMRLIAALSGRPLLRG